MTRTEDDLRSALSTPLDAGSVDRLSALIDSLAEPEAHDVRRRSPLSRLAPLLAAGCAVVIVAVLAVALSGGHRGVRTQSPGAVSDAATAPPRALKLWADFPVDSSPRPLVLTGPAIRDPASGFRNGEDKNAYIAGSFDLATELPPAVAASNGQHLISPADALTDLRNQSKSSMPSTKLTITDVHLGSGVFSTDRGERSLPAWIFAIGGVADPASVLAVSPDDRWPRDGQRLADNDQLAATIALDDRHVTVTFVGGSSGSGPCGTEYAAGVTQSDTAVSVSIREISNPALTPGPSGTRAAVMCTLEGHARKLTITLNPALGNRVLIDSDGAPLQILRSR